MDHTRPPLAIGIESIKRSFVDAKSRGVKLRYLTEITNANISYCKELMAIVDEVRHLDGIKGNFMVSETDYLAPATSHEETKLATLIIYSSVREIVEHQQYVFETLWNKSIENLWKETELYEQLEYQDKMQKEFINIAAHELKTPIQPILGITQVLRSQIKDVKRQELLEIIIRNATRLQRLSNDILDITKIEGKSLELNKEEFNLNDVVINAINDMTLGRDFIKKEKLRLLYNPDRDILIKADKGRISQVISNLLNNAIEFTVEGTIHVSIEQDRISNNNNKTIIVSVKDSGQGIDQSILPRLFTKFGSKSYKGTGLGLFISKGIIEARFAEFFPTYYNTH
jgi:signal transduction histidine kinase